jgi:hypothetical protein
LARNVHFVSGLMESGVDFVAADNPHANKLMVYLLRWDFCKVRLTPVIRKVPRQSSLSDNQEIDMKAKIWVLCTVLADENAPAMLAGSWLPGWQARSPHRLKYS